MFTGFASENTPAIQVWDFFRPFASTSAYRNIALADDCAPIQFFRTGATTTEIQVFLPTAPIEGKQIKIVNNRFAGSIQKLLIVSSDASGDGNFSIVAYIGPGQSIDFCYSKNCISFGTSNGTKATGWISLNQGAASSANYYAISLGGNNNVASGNTSCTVGGSNITASGFASAVISGQNNTASGDNSFLGGGTSNTANNGYATVVGGFGNTASGSSSCVVGSASSIATGQNGSVVGGTANTANAQNSIVLGGNYGTTRSIVGNTVLTANLAPIVNTLGVTQSAILVLGRQTTDATATVLTSNTAAATTTNQVILPNNSAYFFRGEVVAGVTGAGDTKGWTVEGVIKRGVGVGTTTLVGTPTVTSLYADAGATTWSIAVTADTTNGGLKVEVTGRASTTIRWVAQIRTTEMTF
jgi:hypothetical protein